MSNSNSSANCKPALRLISAAWGDAYVDEFLEFCLPALLAPGNLPALAKSFSVEFVLLTEFHQFERVRAHPAYQAAAQFCGARLFAIDDLTAAAREHYGMSITYTLFRGFQDLGAKATDTWLLFMNSDFILADGSYANLIPRLQGDARLVFAPSYCTLERPARQLLHAARKPGDLHVAVPHRAMADWILRHRHYTMRAKIANQRFFSINALDQFYWAVDEKTLLGRQHPVALVAMKPERHMEDVHALWDYGVLADFCPGMNYVALGDSDDFLMMELREPNRASKQLKLGWPSQARIAKGLEHIITSYTRAVGRIPLTLHSADLPSSVAAERAAFDRYVEGAMARLDGRLKTHVDHIQWTVHLSEFHEARRQYLKRFPAGHPTQAEIDALAGSADTDAGRRAQFSQALTLIESVANPQSRDPTSVDIGRLVEAASKYLQNAQQCREQLEREEDRYSRALAAAYRERIGKPADAGQSSQAASIEESLAASHESMQFMVSDSAHRLQLLEDEIPRLAIQCAAAKSNLDSLGLALERMASPIALGRGPLLEAGASLRLRGPGGAGRSGWARRISRALFGSAPAFRWWHVMHSFARVGLGTAARHVADSRRVLVLAKQDLGLFERLVPPAGTVRSVSIELTQARRALVRSLEDEPPFDCCLVEGHVTDLRQFARVFEEVRPLLRPGARLIALFLNMDLGGLQKRDAEFIQFAFPLCGPARTAYAGSLPAAAALFLRRHVENLLRAYLRVPAATAIAAAMFTAAPFALLGSIAESWRTISNSSARPLTPTSITFEIEIG